jgi:hypothetical protein
VKITASLGPVFIFDEKMYHGNGVVRRWADRLTAGFTKNAVVEAPEHTGAMKQQIEGNVTSAGPKQVSMTIASNAPYSLYVLKGTTGPIMANRAWNLMAAKPNLSFDAVFYQKRKKGEGPSRVPRRGMFLKFTGYDGKSHFAASVSGQEANNFLGRAWVKTARTHPSIRGQGIPTSIDF